MKEEQNLSIPKYFGNLTDPRKDNKRHKLIDIITIAICAVICNAYGFKYEGMPRPCHHSVNGVRNRLPALGSNFRRNDDRKIFSIFFKVMICD